MKARSWLLLPSSAVLADAILIAVALSFARAPRHVGGAIALHAVVALAYGVLLVRGVKRAGHEGGGLRLAELGAAVAFFVPVLGSASLMAAIFVLLVTKPKVDVKPFARYALPSALERQPPTEIKPRLVTERLVHIVRWGRSVDARFKAVLATSSAPAVVAIPVLKAALADEAEEVRLSAFSQLERTRRAIEQRIERGREALKGKLAPARTHSLNGSLAQDYYEIAYLGLVEGEGFRQTLKSAADHARAALAIDPNDAALLHLMGRIQMHLGATAEARKSLLAAGAAGMPATELAGDRAEEAFRRRAFGEVVSLLDTMRATSHDHVVLAKLQEFWQWR